MRIKEDKNEKETLNKANKLNEQINKLNMHICKINNIIKIGKTYEGNFY